MADFALGLTKTAVAGTVSSVKSAIEEETKLRVSVQDDLVFITGEFEMMQSFLSASNAGDRASKNLVVRTWVRQLRDLAFDVEDCVEFIVHLDKPSRWDWVRRLALPVTLCMAKPPLPLDVAAGEIKRLKARVEDVSQRNTRYNLIAGDSSPADAHHQLTPYTYTGSSKASSGTLQALLDVWTTTGRFGRHTAIDLKKLIDSDVRELQVISLWRVGSADVGDDAPSSLRNYVHTMKIVYEDPVICQRFENRAWVKLSSLHPSNPVEFVSNLLNQFRSRHHDHHHEDDGHENIAADRRSTISELLQQLSQLRYLVVLENELTTIADWDAIRMYLPAGNQGSRVVVSTNSLGIALVCAGTTYQVSELQRFSHDQGLYAFFPKGCGHRIGMGELIWQLKHSAGVISVVTDNFDEESMFREKRKEIGAVEFGRHVCLDGEDVDLVKLARRFIVNSSPAGDLGKELEGMSGDEIIKRCRQLVTECTCLVFIEGIRSTKDWDSIKQLLLCESTRCRIVALVVDKVSPGLATHCADHDENRVLKARDLIQELGPLEGDVAGSPVIMITEEDGYAQLAGRGYVDDMFMDLDNPGWTYSWWGIAGVGKTDLARIMYKTFGVWYDRCGWVDVPYPFDLTELCRRLLLDFHSDAHGAMESAAVGMTEGQDPIQWCCKILRANRCLLVLDGLRSTHDWDVVKATLLSQPTAGHTLAITREESIATYCTEEREGTAWNVRGLKEDDAILLFEKIALEGKKLSEILWPTEQKIYKLVVSNCGGLPQVIAATAKSVHTKGLRFAMELNSNFIRILQTSSLFTSLRGLFSWMHSYFDALPDELKPCIFYMLVFPADKTIRWSRLLSRWIAEGYLPGGSGTVEEKGKKLLLELMKLSILYSEQQHISSYKVNGFFREYIKSSPIEDNLVFALEESRSTSSRLSGQHLTIRESWKRDRYEFSMMEVSRVRSLTVSGVWESFLVSDKMKVLRVLDMEGTTSTSLCTSVTDDDLEKIVKLCPRLKFLSLRGCVHITHLPDSLGEMRQLQTLDVRYTSIVELPSSITRLHKLQYIRAGTTTDTRPILVQAKPSTPPPSTAAPTPSTPPPPSPPSTQQEVSHGDTSHSLRGAATSASEVSSRITEACKRKSSDLVKSCRSNWWELKNKQNLCSRKRVHENGGGVEVSGAVAEGIGRLIHLHAIGVVNVAGGKDGLVFLKELKKLAQLRKLGLSGINGGNWSKFCDAIRGQLHHLESLSLQLMLLEADGGSYEFACFDDRFQLPTTIKRLKVLYTSEGQVASIGPGWIIKLLNLERFNHELTISTQEDISVLNEMSLQTKVGRWCLRIKPTVEHLSFGRYFTIGKSLEQLSVECSSSNSKVTFEEGFRLYDVSAISIHCCCSPSAGGTSTLASSPCGLEIAGLPNISDLKQVTVTGTYADDLKRKFATQIEEVKRRNS